MINAIDRNAMRGQVRSATPFPHCLINNFLHADFADRVHEAFPTFEQARSVGREFRTVNERNKVQVTNAAMFPPPIAELNRLLAQRQLLELLSYAFGIEDLLPDPELTGGGMHQTGPRGRLDVHVDFNYLPEQKLFRRLNILIYFNKDWAADWGGNLELWDKDVRECRHSFAPLFNRCVIIETTSISYHGVSAVSCPPDRARRSFAAYYYTREAPPDWRGEAQSTIFRSRPNEKVKGRVLMPLEHAGRRMRQSIQDFRKVVKKAVGGPGEPGDGGS